MLDNASNPAVALGNVHASAGSLAERMLRRTMDVVVAGAVLAFTLPLTVGIALSIRFDSPGPLLFRQRRLGLNGKPFWIIKFRTMYFNCPDLRNSDGSAYSGNNDSRVTPVGRVLRNTSLDELPQFWNVLRGDMALVGPRPDQVDQLQYYQDGEQGKLRVKPGITGLAQISGRNSIPWQKRKALDLEYVNQASLMLDISILAKTIPYVLLKRDINTSHDRS